MTHIAFALPELFVAMSAPAPEAWLAKSAEHVDAAVASDMDQHANGKSLTPQQVAWARSHDWYVIPLRQDSGRLGVIVKDCASYRHPDGQVQELYATRAYFSYEDLRAFAGY